MARSMEAIARRRGGEATHQTLNESERHYPGRLGVASLELDSGAAANLLALHYSTSSFEPTRPCSPARRRARWPPLLTLAARTPRLLHSVGEEECIIYLLCVFVEKETEARLPPCAPRASVNQTHSCRPPPLSPTRTGSRGARRNTRRAESRRQQTSFFFPSNLLRRRPERVGGRDAI